LISKSLGGFVCVRCNEMIVEPVVLRPGSFWARYQCAKGHPVRLLDQAGFWRGFWRGLPIAFGLSIGILPIWPSAPVIAVLGGAVLAIYALITLYEGVRLSRRTEPTRQAGYYALGAFVTALIPIVALWLLQLKPHQRLP
jgi:hypothetical protein